MAKLIRYNWQNEYTHRIHWQVSEEHTHSFWEFVFVTKGTAHHCCNGVEKDISAKQLMFVRPTDFHHYKLDGVLPNCLFPPELEEIPYEHRDLYVQTEVMNAAVRFTHCENVLQYLMEPKHPVVINLTGSQCNELESKLNLLEFYDEKNALRFQQVHRSLVCWILGLLVEKLYFGQAQYPDWLNDLLHKMQGPDLIDKSLSEVVAISNFSHGHLCRLFKKYTGERLIDCFARIKAQYACQLLSSTNMSVLEISSRVGYDSQSNFLNQFKKYIGVTPSAYRKSLHML